MCLPDSKIKYSVFYNICVLMFVYYTVCYFTGIFYAVVRQFSVLFIDKKDSVFCTLYSVYMYYFREVVIFDIFSLKFCCC